MHYCMLNSITVKDTDPSPRMDECINTLGDAKYFPTLDAYSRYWQIKIRRKDRPRTAHISHAGTFQYTRMALGPANAPACLQSALEMILTKDKWSTSLVYVDNVIIFLRNLNYYIGHVGETLSNLVDAGVTLETNNCHVFQRKVDNLGHMVEPGRLEIDKRNAETLHQAQISHTRLTFVRFSGYATSIDVSWTTLPK